jgi:hypothetical protein
MLQWDGRKCYIFFCEIFVLSFSEQVDYPFVIMNHPDWIIFIHLNQAICFN